MFDNLRVDVEEEEDQLVDRVTILKSEQRLDVDRMLKKRAAKRGSHIKGFDFS